MTTSSFPFLTERRASAIVDALRSPMVDALAELLWSLRRGIAVASPDEDALALARALELVRPPAHPPAHLGGPLELTRPGALVSDSLTEYAYWRRRGKRHHAADEVDALAESELAGKRILEIGCGAGVNLISLQRGARVVGVDVVPEYLAFAELIARAEDVELPRCVCARAERLPFPDESFDVALFPGSLPYMRIELALSEAARVLQPGGLAILVFSDFGQMLEHRAERWTVLRPTALLREAREVAGTLAYPWIGRTILKDGAAVHPTRRTTRRLLESAGLAVDPRAIVLRGDETCWVAAKLTRRARASTAPIGVA